MARLRKLPDTPPQIAFAASGSGVAGRCPSSPAHQRACRVHHRGRSRRVGPPRQGWYHELNLPLLESFAKETRGPAMRLRGTGHSPVLNLRVGDVVEVRSEQEILETLDARGTLEGLPFMPEMLKYRGKR